MSREAFLPHLKSTFLLDSGSSATLLNVSTAQQTASSTSTFVSFSLLFSAPAGSPAESRIYQVTHPKMGELELFISPVGHSKELVHLEAICSQRV